MANGIEHWLDAMSGAAEELAQTILGFDGCQVMKRRDSLPDNLSGAYIAMVGEETSTQLGIAASKEGCDILARALMGMEPDEDLEEEDVADAMGEVANIVAGAVKTRLTDEDGSFSLGLPLIIHGKVEVAKQVTVGAADVLIGPVPAYFLVLQSMRAQ